MVAQPVKYITKITPNLNCQVADLNIFLLHQPLLALREDLAARAPGKRYCSPTLRARVRIVVSSKEKSGSAREMGP